MFHQKIIRILQSTFFYQLQPKTLHINQQHNFAEIQTCSKSYLSSFPDHDVVIVTISDAQDVSSYTVASAGQCELLYRLIKFVPGDIKGHRNEEAEHERVVFLQCFHTSLIFPISACITQTQPWSRVSSVTEHMKCSKRSSCGWLTPDRHILSQPRRAEGSLCFLY